MIMNQKEEKYMIYFTSDLHLGHENAIKHCGRPFSSAEEMDEYIVSNWNKRVHKDDTVYIVGDITLKNVGGDEFVRRLKGKKILICGNHDQFIRQPGATELFEDIKMMEELHINGKRVTLCHYPMIEWPGSRRDPGTKPYGYLVYGHIHNGVKEIFRHLYESENAFNAGMDVNGFIPVTWDELVENNMAYRKKAIELLKRLPEGEKTLVRFTDMTLNETPFRQIERGEKTVEIRLNDEKRQQLQVGDLIRFTLKDGNERLFVEVTSLKHFPSFHKAFTYNKRVTEAGFGEMTAAQAATEMRKYYSEKDEQENGVLAIGVKLFYKNEQ